MESRRAAVAADSADYSRAVTHWAIAHSDAVMARHAILTGINITLLLVTVIGGRIVPAFTASALRTSAAPAGLIALPCPLVVDPAIALGYGFLLMAALTRVFGLSVWRSLCSWLSMRRFSGHPGLMESPVESALSCGRPG